VSKRNGSSTEQRGRIISTNLLAVLLLMQPRMPLDFLAAKGQSQDKRRLQGDISPK